MHSQQTHSFSKWNKEDDMREECMNVMRERNTKQKRIFIIISDHNQFKLFKSLAY